VNERPVQHSPIVQFEWYYQFQSEAPLDISPVSLSEVDNSQQSVLTELQISEELARLTPVVADGSKSPLQSGTAAVHKDQVEETPPVAKKRAHESTDEPKAAENKSSSSANPL